MPDLTLSSHKHLGQFIFFLHKDTNIYLISNAEDFTEQSLLAHRMKDVKSLNFRQYWREQEDELCDGKKVLQPAELVFVGLKK